MNGSFLLNICFLYFTTVLLCNSLTPKSGWLPISPHIITPNISPLQCQNKGNDPQLKMLLTGQQIFLVRSLGNVWKTVWRTCILTLRCKGVWNTLFNTFPYLQQWQPLNLRQPVKTSLKCKSWLSPWVVETLVTVLSSNSLTQRIRPHVIACYSSNSLEKIVF